MKKILGIIILALIAFASCVRDIPHLTAGTMEDLLYDLHKAQYASSYGEDKYDYNEYVYSKAVLQKYGVTQEDFDSSMIYYLRHSDELHKIYENIHERLSNEALSLGADVSDFNRYSDFSANGDTSNIWRENKFSVLTSYKPYNYIAFKYAADSSYHAGDKFILEFNPKFHYQDGFRNATAMLAIKYNNDSVIHTVTTFSMDAYQSITLEASPDFKIKSISGFILQNKNLNETTTTLKLIFLDNIRLIRCHQVTTPSQQVADNDSTETTLPSKREELQKDTVKNLNAKDSSKMMRKMLKAPTNTLPRKRAPKDVVLPKKL